MLRPKVSAIYDQGTAPYREDGLVVGTTLFGVFDGVSAPHAPRYPIRLFGDLSGGAVVARLCERLFHAADGNQATDLAQLVGKVNERVKKDQDFFALTLGLPHLPVEDSAGATFAIVRLGNKTIEIVQAGDALAIVKLRNGNIVVSPNQVREHDKAMHSEIERLQREVALEMLGLPLEDVPDKDRGRVRGEMWNRFYHTLRNARGQDANSPTSPRGYAIINGDPALRNMMWRQTFSREEISTILICTDGVIPWPVMKATDDHAVARAVLEEFHRHGVAGLLFAARGIEEQNVATAYTNQAEATAVALQF